MHYLRKISDESISCIVPPWTFESKSENTTKIYVKSEVTNDEFEVDNSGIPESEDNNDQFDNENFEYNETPQVSLQDLERANDLVSRDYLIEFLQQLRNRGPETRPMEM